MANWEDEDEDEDYGDLEPFDPAKSVIPHDNYFLWPDTVCKDRFIELFFRQFPELGLDKKEFSDQFPLEGICLIVENYVKGIIRHYYDSKLPYEDDLKPVDKTNFPDNAEIKRFLIANGNSIDFYVIDRFTNSQPSDLDKEIQLQSLQEYFKLVKALAFDYYPQLEHLPARGFRELERSLYTINYLYWTSMHEAKDRLLGINKPFYDELDLKRKERDDKRRERWKKQQEAEGESFYEKYEKMTDEEMDEREKEWEESDKLIMKEHAMREQLLFQMSDKFLEIYPELNFPREDFIAKVDSECWITYRDTFYIVHKMLEHYKISNERYNKDARVPTVFSAYKTYQELLKKGNQQDMDDFLSDLEDWDKGWLEFDIKWNEMAKTMLKVIYDTFPKMIDLPASAMLEVKNEVFGLARFNLKEMFAARDRLLKVSTEIFEKHDKQIEDMRRQKFNEGKL